MSLRYAVWCYGLGTVQTPHLPENTPFDYTAQSPISGKFKHYDEQEVQKELLLIAKESEGTKFSIGQQLYYQAHFFVNPVYLLKNDYYKIIEEYQIMKESNLPLARTLDEAPANKIRQMQIIHSEVEKLKQHLLEKNNGTR